LFDIFNLVNYMYVIRGVEKV